MRRIILIIIVLQTGCPFLRAQPKDTLIDPDHFNYRLMEYMIKSRIDSFRKTKKLGALANDSLLYKAALDQAIYLEKRSEISHTQPARRKKDPMARAVYYGASYQMIGENVARIFYLVNMTNPRLRGRTVFIRTYSEAANEFVEGWLHSPHHYKNIVTSGYDVTGLAISMNPKEKSITAVQVFGRAPTYHPPDRSRVYFPYGD